MKIKNLILSFILLIQILTQESPEESPQEEYSSNDVLILNDTSVESQIKKDNVLLLLVYASWCPHCKEFKPIYLELSKKVKNENLNYTIAVIEGDKNSNFSEAHNIQGFPTILLFIKQGEEEVEYLGTKNVDSIIKFIKKRTESAFSVLNNVNEVNSFLKENKLLLLFSDKNSDREKIFKEFAEKITLYEFAICQSEDCLNKYNNDIIFFRPYDEEYVSLNNFLKESNLEFSRDNFQNFISIYCIEMGGTLSEIHPYYINEYSKSAFFLFRNDKDSNLDKLFKELAKEFRNEYYFLVSNIDNEIGKETSSFFYIEENEIPRVSFLENFGEHSNVYKMKNNEINKENIIKFMNDVKEKKILSLLASSSFPDKEIMDKYNDKFKIVIGKTYDKEIIQDEKNVLVLMHSTYDENEDFEIFIKLIEKYKDNKEYNLKFCSYEVNGNEVRYGGDPLKLPTLYLYLSNNKENPEIFLGSYDYEELEKWIEYVFNGDKDSNFETSTNEEINKESENNKNDNEKSDL